MEPPIRILRRPCPVSSEKPKANQGPPVVVRTLEQREADYAAARRRIMGSDAPEASEWEGSSERESMTSQEQPANTDANKPYTNRSQHSLSDQNSLAAAGNLVSDIPTATQSLGLQSNVQVHEIQGNRQSLAVVNVGRKLQQQQQQQQQSQPVSSGTRQNIQSQQQQQPRIMSASASNTFFPNSGRLVQPLPLFSSQVGNCNAGLLPTPPGLNYSLQSATPNNGFNNSQTAAIALMHQFNLLQQHYQQTLNGIHNHLVSSATHTSNSFNPFHFSAISQPNNNPKYTHPPTFH